MSLQDYTQFQAAIRGLAAWNPDREYISKNLALKNKPKKTCFRRIFGISNASQAVTATSFIYEKMLEHHDRLVQDEDTLKRLILVNKKIKKNLARISAPHRLKRAKRRQSLLLNCSKIKSESKKTFDLIGGKGQRKFLNDFSSSDDETPSLSRYGTPPLPRDKTISAFKSISQFDDFIDAMNPSSFTDALKLFKELQNALTNSNLSKILEQPVGEKLLVKIRKIKNQFANKKNNKDKKNLELQKAVHELRKTIRKHFFADRIKKMDEQLQLIEANANSFANSTVHKIIKVWREELSKYKPIKIPKYFHCTDKIYVDRIINDDIGIQKEPSGVKKKGYDGAFASSHRETGYGSFCFGLSDYVETVALADGKAPLVTHLDTYGQAEFIYVGNPPKTRKLVQGYSKFPKIWLGFQQNIQLKRPDKEKYPLRYYADTTFCLFSANDLSAISQESAQELKRRKVRLLENEDFTILISLIQRSLHFTLPYSWKTKAITPPYTSIAIKEIPSKPYIKSNQVELQDLQGVVVSS